MSSRPRKKSTIIVALLVIAVVNVAAGAAYFAARNKALREAPPPASDPKQDLERAARAQGLAELERGNFAAAASSFKRAIDLGGSNPETIELLRIATDLRDNAGKAPADAPAAEPVAAKTDSTAPQPKPATEPTGLSTTPDRGAPERTSHRDKKKPAPPPRPVNKREDVEERGTVIVTSSPSGLSVVADGQAVGNTPIRFTVEAGMHTVELYSGRISVFSKDVTVFAGRAVSLDPTIDSLVQPAPAPTPPPQPTVVTPPPPPTPPEEPKPKPAPPEPAPEVKPTGLVILANPSVPGSRVTTAELRSAYTGESTTLNGSNVVLVMRPLGSSASAALLSRIGMQQRSFKDQWGKLQYYGGRTPPRTMASLSDIVRYLASTPGAICPLLASDLEELPPNTLKRMPVN